MNLDYEQVEERLRSLGRHVTNIGDKSSNANMQHQRKKSNLRVKYNMSLEEHTKKSNDQDNMCAICKKKFGEAKVSMPHVDHCHKTGKIRDLLCSKCNVALGCIDEDPKIASNIIKYIKKWS